MVRLYPGRVGPGRRVRTTPESLLASGAAFVGLVGIVSSLTPELANRSDLVRGVLPPGVPAAARVGALAFGIALVWLSRSLSRRRRRAWQLAVALVVASAGAHLAKGLDFEEAMVSLLLLGALVRHRRRFEVPGDPATVRPLLTLGAALAAAGAASIAIELRGSELPDRAADLFAAVGLLLGFAALYLWLRPLSLAVVQTIGERGVVRALVDTYGRDSLSFFALRRDKSYLFSPNRRAFLAYRVVGGSALVSGDPVGDECEFDALLREMFLLARAHGWRLAVLGAAAEQLDRYRRLGLRPILIGEEAVLRPATFSLEGRAIRKVRQSVSRLTKAGYRLRIVAAEDADDRQRAVFDDVSRQWRGNQPERGFSMSIDDLYAPGTLFAVAEHEDGNGRRVPPSRAGAGRRWLVVEHDAAPTADPERPQRIPRRRDARVGQEATGDGTFPQLLRVHRSTLARTRDRLAAASGSPGPPLGRRPLPARATLRLQPEVLPGVATPLRLRPNALRPTARGPRVPPHRISAHPTRTMGTATAPARVALRSCSRIVSRSAPPR